MAAAAVRGRRGRVGVGVEVEGKGGKTARAGKSGANRVIERIWRESGRCFGGRSLLCSGPCFPRV